MKMSKTKKLIKKVTKMDLGNPVITTLIGLVVFYIGLKMFSGGMKSMGNLDHLSYFIHNPYYMFAGLGAHIGTTGTIWLAGVLVSDGMPKGDTLRIAMAHTGMNLLMAISLLPFVHHIARFLTRFT